MSNFFNYNGKLFENSKAVITPANRSLRYGDGLFETIKMFNDEIQLKNYHFDRLFSGMKLLEFEIPASFTPHFFQQQITSLCKKNNHGAAARVRLNVFRGNGNKNDLENNLPGFIIESFSIEYSPQLNANGLMLKLFQKAKKSCDEYANLKSNNYLPYAMAALHAKHNNADDCILLNTYGRICDTSIANIFIIKDDLIYTPPLAEGCIAGVMRRAVFEKLPQAGYHVQEKPISIHELENADEVFLTNAIRGVRWVKQFLNKTYSNKIIKDIWKVMQAPLS